MVKMKININMNRREKYLLFFLAIILLIYIYMQYFLMPIINNIDISKQNIERNNSLISQLKVVEFGNKALKDELSRAKINYDNALTALPLLEKNPEIVYNIKPIADKAKVTIQDVSMGDGALYIPQASTAKNYSLPYRGINIYCVNVNLNVKSDNYSNMMDFVNGLENDKRIDEITDFSMQYQKSNSTNTSNQTSISSGTDTQTSNANHVNVDTSAVNANISINYFYSLDNNIKPKYDFNKGTYGKSDIFN
jgi:hypothetical protein